MNLEVTKHKPQDARNGIEPSTESKNFRRLLSLNNKTRTTESRLSQPRPSVWTLNDIQKVLPKQGPTSLFILKENNPVRKYVRLVAESKYPFIISRSSFDAILVGRESRFDLVCISLCAHHLSRVDFLWCWRTEAFNHNSLLPSNLPIIPVSLSEKFWLIIPVEISAWPCFIFFPYIYIYILISVYPEFMIYKLTGMFIHNLYSKTHSSSHDCFMNNSWRGITNKLLSSFSFEVLIMLSTSCLVMFLHGAEQESSDITLQLNKSCCHKAWASLIN